MTQQDIDAGQRSAAHFYRRPAGFCGECGAPRADLSGPVCAACGVIFAAAQPLSPVGPGVSPHYVAPPDYVAPPTELRMPITGPAQVSAPWGPPHQMAPGQYPIQQPVVTGQHKNAFILIAGIVALVAVVVTAALLTGRGSSVKQPGVFTMSGSQTIVDTNFSVGAGGCHGINAYNDIYEGTNITVYNNAGTIVGVGGLDAGVGRNFDECYFTFSISDIPAGQGPYQWEVAHRGRLTISEADARSGGAIGIIRP